MNAGDDLFAGVDLAQPGSDETSVMVGERVYRIARAELPYLAGADQRFKISWTEPGRQGVVGGFFPSHAAAVQFLIALGAVP